MSTAITRISKTKQGRFALFTYDEFLFSVDGETLLRNDIKEDIVLSDSELAVLKSEGDTRKAKDKALQYLSLRDYASKELYDKLCLKFDEETAAVAVAEMCRLDLIDDAAFAVHRAKYLVGQRKSRREIQRILSQKGICREDIETALCEIDGSDISAIAAIIEKSYLSKLQNGEGDKVIAALMRRGFAYREVKTAIEKYTDNYNDTNGDFE
ncbi:MAG: RecX family transcriptional regulator [Oscillospiraceae bacterium]